LSEVREKTAYTGKSEKETEKSTGGKGEGIKEKRSIGQGIEKRLKTTKNN